MIETSQIEDIFGWSAAMCRKATYTGFVEYTADKSSSVLVEYPSTVATLNFYRKYPTDGAPPEPANSNFLLKGYSMTNVIGVTVEFTFDG